MCERCLYSCIVASFHVEPTVKEQLTLEAEEPEAEYQQELELESYQTADQEYDYTNFESQQSKHRCILTQCRTSVESLIIYFNLCIKFIGTV